MASKINITSMQIRDFFMHSAVYMQSQLSDINDRVAQVATATVAQKESKVVQKKHSDSIDSFSSWECLRAIQSGISCADDKSQQKQEEILTATSTCVEASIEVKPSEKEPKELGYETLQLLLDQVNALLQESSDFIDKPYFIQQVGRVKEYILVLYQAQQPYPQGLAPAALLAHPLTKQIQLAKQAVTNKYSTIKGAIIAILEKIKELQKDNAFALRSNDRKRTEAESHLEERKYDGSLSRGGVEVSSTQVAIPRGVGVVQSREEASLFSTLQDGRKQKTAHEASYLLASSCRKDRPYLLREAAYDTLEKISNLFNVHFSTA